MPGPSKNTEQEQVSVATTKPETQNRTECPSAVHLVGIALVGLICRAFTFFAFTPIWNGPAGDSPGYAATWFLWSNRYFYNGERTPVYPFFLGFAQWLAHVPSAVEMAARGIYVTAILQSALGIAAACLLYLTLRILRIRPSAAYATGLACTLIAATWLFEITILTQALSLFLLVTAALLFALLMRRIADGGNTRLLSLVTGVVFGLAALLRSENLVFVSVLIVALAFVALRRGIQQTV